MRGGRQSFVAPDQGASRWEPSPHAPRGFAPVASVGVRVFGLKTTHRNSAETGGVRGAYRYPRPWGLAPVVRPRVAGN